MTRINHFTTAQIASRKTTRVAKQTIKTAKTTQEEAKKNANEDENVERRKNAEIDEEENARIDEENVEKQKKNESMLNCKRKLINNIQNVADDQKIKNTFFFNRVYDRFLSIIFALILVVDYF